MTSTALAQSPLRTRVRRGLSELVLVLALYGGYSLTRLIADDSPGPAVARAHRILNLERFFGLDIEATVNGWFIDNSTLGLMGSYYYASAHYLVTGVVLVWLWRRGSADLPARPGWRWCVATMMALALYLLLPTAPPRFVEGFTDVLRLSAAHGWWSSDASAPKGMGGYTNELAAFPSMHAGWALWVAFVVQLEVRRRWVRGPRLGARRHHRRRSSSEPATTGPRRGGGLGRGGGRPGRRLPAARGRLHALLTGAGEASQRLAHHRRVGRRPHRRQARAQEGAVARGHQPRVEHGHDAPVRRGPDQPAGALGQQQRGVGRGHLHEAVAAGLVGGALPRRHQRVVGARERDPVDDHQLAGVAGDVETLPQRQGAEQAGVRVTDELLGQLGQLRLALGERGEVRQPLADHLGGPLGGAARGEQPQRAALRGVDQLDDLVELRARRARRDPAGAGARRRRGWPACRSRRVSPRRARATGGRRRARRARPTGRVVHALGGLEPHRRRHRREVAAEHQGGGGEDRGLVR